MCIVTRGCSYSLLFKFTSKAPSLSELQSVVISDSEANNLKSPINIDISASTGLLSIFAPTYNPSWSNFFFNQSMTNVKEQLHRGAGTPGLRLVYQTLGWLSLIKWSFSSTYPNYQSCLAKTDIKLCQRQVGQVVRPPSWRVSGDLFSAALAKYLWIHRLYVQ